MLAGLSRYLVGSVFVILSTASAQLQAEELSLSGLYIGGPAGQLADDQGKISGLIGVRHLFLNYKKRFNYFGTLAIATDAFTTENDFPGAFEVDDLPANQPLIGDSVYGGFLASAGITYNANSFDNIIFNLGAEITLGSTFIETDAGRFLKVSDQRLGFVGGITIGLEKAFFGVDYSSTTESLRASIGIAY